MQNTENIHQQRFVRVRGIRNGFVEFDFAIGSPELYIELILNKAAFEEFCETNKVQQLSDEDAAQIDAYRERWCEPVSSDHTVQDKN